MSPNEQTVKAKVMDEAGKHTLGASDRSLAGAYHQAYHEIADQHVVERDVLGQLQFHVQQLEDLHYRFQFMMREVRGLIK